MGTNYYHRIDGGIFGIDERHIGKSSGGWCFSLHVYPEENINTLNDWKKLLIQGEIYDEYGDKISYDELINIITKRSWDNEWITNVYYRSYAEFLRKNNAVKGPNNLVRHAIGDHCIGHGKGTWDYIIGKFS